MVQPYFYFVRCYQSPNKSPEPMPIGHGSSAIAVVRFECGMAQLEALALRATRFGLRGRPPSFPFSRAAFDLAALFIWPSATAAGFFPISASGRNASTIRRAFSSSVSFMVFCRGGRLGSLAVQFRYRTASVDSLSSRIGYNRQGDFQAIPVFLRVATRHERRAIPARVRRRREVHLSRFF